MESFVNKLRMLASLALLTFAFAGCTAEAAQAEEDVEESSASLQRTVCGGTINDDGECVTSCCTINSSGTVTGCSSHNQGRGIPPGLCY
jgi:translation initiation factor 6 (eIF-6)